MPTPALRPSVAELRRLLHLRPYRHTLSHAQSLPFVGRGAELRSLTDHQQRAAAGRPQFVLVSGESGIGKSTLATQASARAREAGFTVLRGRCYERAQLPFVAFDQLMDACVLALSRWEPEAREAVRRDLARLELLFPAFGILLSSSDQQVTPPPDEPQARYNQAQDSLRHLLTAFQERAPLMLVLDDLQWADRESVDLLLALLQATGQRLMVLGLARPEALQERHTAARLVDQARRGSGSALVELGPLGPEPARRLAAAAISDPQRVERLTAIAGGNPFLTARLAHLLNLIDLDESAALLDSDLSPDAVLEHLFAHISPQAERLLAVAATAQSAIRDEMLRGVCDLAPEAYDKALGELLAAQLLKALLVRDLPSSVDHTWLDVYHDRIRETAYARLDPDDRVAIHTRMARAIEAHTGRDADTHDIEALLHHWSAAGDKARRHRLALQASQHAAELLAFSRAAALLRVAIAHHDGAFSTLQLAARWEEAGRHHEQCGEFEDAYDAHHQALALWEEQLSGHPERPTALLRLRTLTGRALFASGRLSEGRAAFEQGSRQLGLPTHTPSLPRLIATIVWYRLRIALAKPLAQLTRPRRATPFEHEQLHFFTTSSQMSMSVWPAYSIPNALRAELIGARLNDHGVLLFQALFATVMLAVLMGRPTPRGIASATERLDEAEARLRVEQLTGGAEQLQIYRALLWVASDLGRAHNTLTSALEGLSHQGRLHSIDGSIAKVLYALTLSQRHQRDALDAFVTRDMLTGRADFINTIHYTFFRAHLAGWLNDREALWRRLEEMEALMEGQPECQPSQQVEQVRILTLAAYGHLREALEHHDRNALRPHKYPNPWSNYRIATLETEVRISLSLLRRGARDAATRRRIARGARRLKRYHLVGYDAMGVCAEALLDHDAGRAKQARVKIRQALKASEVNCVPYFRWFTLTAAQELGQLNLDLEAELEALASEHGFTHLPDAPLDLPGPIPG